MKKSKMVVWEDLQIAVKRRKVKNQRRKGKIYLFECRVPKNNNERQERLLQGSVQKIEENNRMGKTRDSSRKLEIPREHFMQRWSQ